MELNYLIKKWRKEANLTLEGLAKLTNLTPQSISLYEHNKRSVSMDTLKLIAKALNKTVVIDVLDKGEIPITNSQRRKIEDICFGERDIREQYDMLKTLFDIKDEELEAGKLFDDMDEKEYLKFSPSKTITTKDGYIMDKNIHCDELMLYYACLGGKVEYNEFGEFKSVEIHDYMEEFQPPRRTSKDGFITEQRRLLLPLLNECFQFEGFKIKSFDFRTFRRKIGF